MSSGAAHSQHLHKIPACSYKSFRLSFNLLLSYPAGAFKSCYFCTHVQLDPIGFYSTMRLQILDKILSITI